MDSIRSPETAFAILQKENKSQMDQIKEKDVLKSVCYACSPPLSNIIQHLISQNNKENNYQSEINLLSFETQNPFSPLAQVSDDF